MPFSNWEETMKTKLRVLVILICLVSQLVMGVNLAEAADPGVYVVQRGDTLYSIARRYGTTVNAIVQANGLRNSNWIYVGQRLVIPGAGTTTTSGSSGSSSSGSVHVVQRGENLFRIALRYGTTVQALAQANNLSNTSLIYVGQRLVIPGGGSASPAAAPSAVSAPTSGKWIEIKLASQSLVAYEGQRPVYWATVSTGTYRTPTPKGSFRIYSKLRSGSMAGPGCYFPNVPYIMNFYGGYSIHGTYWHNSFGWPMSHGCVNMKISDAQWLYNWAPIGTLVVIR
jgi:LysM repeat protein